MYLTEERNWRSHFFTSLHCVHVQPLSSKLSRIPAVFCFGRYCVYSRSWADLPPEAPWSLKWSELIYLCLLLCLYLLLVLTIKILTTFKKKKNKSYINKPIITDKHTAVYTLLCYLVSSVLYNMQETLPLVNNLIIQKHTAIYIFPIIKHFTVLRAPDDYKIIQLVWITSH